MFYPIPHFYGIFIVYITDVIITYNSQYTQNILFTIKGKPKEIGVLIYIYKRI